ncbi:MAG: hypothetical protein GY930_20485 [bacterium]|nr:hypothetical protein [bacterium]
MRLPLCIPLLALIACSQTRTSQTKEGLPVRALLTPEHGVALEVSATSTVVAGSYFAPAIDGQEGRGVLRLVGLEDVELDLTGVEMLGGGPEDAQDELVGVGLLVEDCRNVHIIGGVWKGYRQPILVRNSASVTIENTDFSDLWADCLQSTVTGDSDLDWIDPGSEKTRSTPAAITAQNVDDLVVRFCKVRHAQTGVLLSGVERGFVHDNDFSFLSGWGIALIDSTECTVSYNATEYDVRGYSPGAYAVGHNSAGILLAGASTGNEVAFNRATHCGTGVLLWGRDEGEGRPDDNQIFGNDCSSAIKAGVGLVRSNNTLVHNNRVQNGLGYGIHSLDNDHLILLDNVIKNIRGRGIALHGTSSGIVYSNTIFDCQVGLEVGGSAPSGPFSQAGTDRLSQDHYFLANQFGNNAQDLVASESQALSFAGNRFEGGKQRLHVMGINAWLEPGTDLVESEDAQGEDTVVGWLAGSNGVTPTGSVEGVSLRLWDGTLPADLKAAQAFEPTLVDGHPASSASVRSEFVEGPDTVVLGRFGPWDFPSEEVQTQLRRPGGVFSGTYWQASWFRFDPETQDPRGDIEVWRGLADEPLLERTVEHFLDPRPSDEIKALVPKVQFGLVADTEIEILEAGEYKLSVMSDDGLRLWFGDTVVFEDWRWQASERKQIQLTLEKGVQKVRLEYFQLDGASELALELHLR